MSRFALVAVIAALLLAIAPAAAQTPEPVGIVSADETSVFRAYDNPAGLFRGVIGVFAVGFIAGSESDATEMVTTMPAIFAASVATAGEADGAVFEEPAEVPMTPLGDQSTATRMGFSETGGPSGEVVVTTVRQGAWVQMLMGMATGSVPVQPELEGIATTLLARWPSMEPVTVRPDGLRTGGIWAMMPLPEDMPAGYSVDPEVEEGPGPTAGATAPGATPAEPTRDLPLLPTPTPATGETPPAPPAGETPVVVPPVDAPTPAGPTPPPNPRLALPFDVTIEVFLPIQLATVEADGSCVGTGLLDGLAPDGGLTLQATTGTEGSATAPFDIAGVVALDTETGEEVCYFRATLAQVPARASYTLLAGESVLGRFAYADLTTGEPVLVEITAPAD